MVGANRRGIEQVLVEHLLRQRLAVHALAPVGPPPFAADDDDRGHAFSITADRYPGLQRVF